MKVAAVALAALLAAGQASSAPPPDLPQDLPSGPIELDGRPLRLAALTGADGGVEVLLLGGRELERFRLHGRALERLGAFRAPVKRARPLLVDAAPADGGSLVPVLFAEDVQSVDEGTDTRLHAWILSAGEDGSLRAVSEDLEAYVRLSGGSAYAQRRGPNRLLDGPVRAVEEVEGRFRLGEAPVPWASRWLLATTPLPGGLLALAWEEGRPVLASREGGARVPGGALLGDLGTVREPQVAVRLERPVFALGMDKEGRKNEEWHTVPRRVAMGSDGAAYTIARGRSGGLPVFGRTSGQDSVVRLDASGGGLALTRPFPGIDAYVLDFALVERPGLAPAAVLLLNEEDDGSGRAYLLFQTPR